MVRRFKPNRDFDQINEWLKLRGFEKLPSKEEYSSTGMMIDSVAVAFLYYTNSSIAILGNCISNPKSSKDERAAGIREITNKLIELAKESGYKHVKYDTCIGSIEDVAIDLGFTKLGTFKSFVKEI